jgi:hypothetical protein
MTSSHNKPQRVNVQYKHGPPLKIVLEDMQIVNCNLIVYFHCRKDKEHALMCNSPLRFGHLFAN